MSGAIAQKIETALDAVAAALFAAGVAYALGRVSGSSVLGAGGAAIPAFLGCFAALRRVPAEAPGFDLPEFGLAPLPDEPFDELLLTDRAEPSPQPSREAEDVVLVLEDILARIGPDSRVVRLFDPSAMPTPGQLKDRIDQHFHEESPQAAPPDASQALSEALAELRRSLR
jgi:hypothetical protein